MNGFTSYRSELKGRIEQFIAAPALHARWLNTLSCLENGGARKIAACQHPKLVKEEMLKHASEEFRHAHYLKRQIGRLNAGILADYSLSNILGGAATWHYLPALDLRVCRLLRDAGVGPGALREAAYLLVTYAIELRAGELYATYDELLRRGRSPVAVRSIILEEKEHLREMEEGIALMPAAAAFANEACAIESLLCSRWLKSLSTNRL